MSKKIVLIGDGNVGKKNLLRRFVDGKAFDIENIHIPTIGDSQEEAIDNSKNVPIIEKNGNIKSSIYTLMDKLKLGTKMESKSICNHIQKFEKTQCQNIKIRTISQRLIDAMGFGDLTFESAADINSSHPKDKTNRSMKIDNKLKDYTKLMVSIGVILSAHHGFMFPDSEELFATLDASDQEKILDMLQNEIVTLEKMAKEDVLDEITFDPDANIDLSEIVTWEIMAKEEEFYIHIFNLFLFLYFKTYKKKEFKRLKRFIPDGTENNVLNWKNVFNKNMYPQSPTLASGLNMKNAEDLILASLSKMISLLITSIAWNGLVLFMGSLTGFLFAFSSIVIRSMLSKCVTKAELGKIFSLLASLEALVPLVSAPLFTLIYTTTLDTWSGAVFLVLVPRKTVFNKNMYPQSLMMASGLSIKNQEDLIHDYEKEETRQRRIYENNLGGQVSLDVILLANQGFMSPDYESVLDTLDASDQDKFLHMLQNEIVTHDNMINDDLVEDENHYYHHKSDTMKSQKNLLFKRSINGGKCSLENENYYNKNENMASKFILV